MVLWHTSYMDVTNVSTVVLGPPSVSPSIYFHVAIL